MDKPGYQDASGSPVKRPSGGYSTPSVSYGGHRSPSRHVVYSDRHIPSRAASSRLDYSLLERDAATELPAPGRGGGAGSGEGLGQDAGSQAAYAQLLRSQLLGCPPGSPERASVGSSAAGHAASMVPRSPSKSPARKLFRYTTGDVDGLRAPGEPALLSPAGAYGSPQRAERRIPRTPFKVLDAPGLSDDFYLSLLDWSATNVIAVGLASSVYLWSASNSKVTQLVDVGPDDVVTSVAWSSRGNYLAVGTGSGALQIWDAAKNIKIREMGGHTARVTCMSWCSGALASGSRDRGILLRDPRDEAPFHTCLSGHRSEICGLSWAPDTRHLASGGNDNTLCVWDARGAAGATGATGITSPTPASSPRFRTATTPVHRWREHEAAVKALAWSPHSHGVLASGGGSADRTIRIWSATRGSCLQTVDTGSQVCALAWARNANEIVSAHGYSQNQMHVWRCPSMTKVATLTGHSSRVLYLSVSPDGQTVVTGAGDETLRFWNIFPEAKGKTGAMARDIGSHVRASIR